MAVGRVRRFEVFLVDLNPTKGSKINKMRPCVVISPDEMNRYIRTVIIAPMTTKQRPYPTRVLLTFQGRSGEIVLDHVRTIDKSRLTKKLGSIHPKTSDKVLGVLREMFD